MKKIVSLLIAVMMISTVAFGAVSIDTANTTAKYKTITVNYTGYETGEYATVLVYQVKNDSSAPAYDAAAGHEIVGINQDTATGTFDIVLDEPNYTGYLVAAVGAENSDAVRYSIEVIGGVPVSVTAPINCENGEITVPNGKTLNIGYLNLVNAIVNKEDGGTITYTNENTEDLDLAGSIYFDENGNIHSATDENPVTLTLTTGETMAVGFIWDDYIDTVNGPAGTYKYSVTDGTKTTPDNTGFAIESGIKGNVRFAVGVTGVPVSSNLSISINGIQ